MDYAILQENYPVKSPKFFSRYLQLNMLQRVFGGRFFCGVIRWRGFWLLVWLGGSQIEVDLLLVYCVFRQDGE
jgi:hypothetical protein